MNQRLVWNFELTPTTALSLAAFADKKDENIKWEIRCFWQGNEIIILNNIDKSLLGLVNYQQKYKEDYYYLLPNNDYNIKRRREQLLYKPLLKHGKHAAGYGAKIILGSSPEQPKQAELINPDLQEITLQVKKEAMEIEVKKESFIYKFPSAPTVKIELARLEVRHKIYFSVCVEGKSLYLVETISKHLMGEHVSCDYVTFLKNILKL